MKNKDSVLFAGFVHEGPPMEERVPTVTQIGEAQGKLLEAEIPLEKWTVVTGFGHRRYPGCKPEDTILNKVAAGALSIVGVQAVLAELDGLPRGSAQ